MGGRTLDLLLVQHRAFALDESLVLNDFLGRFSDQLTVLAFQFEGVRNHRIGIDSLEWHHVQALVQASLLQGSLKHRFHYAVDCLVGNARDHSGYRRLEHAGVAAGLRHLLSQLVTGRQTHITQVRH